MQLTSSTQPAVTAEVALHGLLSRVDSALREESPDTIEITEGLPNVINPESIAQVVAGYCSKQACLLRGPTPFGKYYEIDVITSRGPRTMYIYPHKHGSEIIILDDPTDTYHEVLGPVL